MRAKVRMWIRNDSRRTSCLAEEPVETVRAIQPMRCPAADPVETGLCARGTLCLPSRGYKHRALRSSLLFLCGSRRISEYRRWGFPSPFVLRPPSFVRAFLALSVGIMSVGPVFAQAQQVPIPEETSTAPQLDVAGVGVATLDALRPRNPLPGGGTASGSQVNFADSALLIGAAQRLYRGAIGSVAFGGLATDENNTGNKTSFFIHQLFADYQSKTLEGYVGRTDTPAAQLVQFPTLRGDDLVTFTSLLDPFSNGDSQEEHRYSNVAAVVLNQSLKSFENVHVQHLIDSSGAGGPGDTGLNSFGVTFQWLNLPAMAPVQRVVSYGAGFEHRSVGGADGGASNAVYGGGEINLRRSLTNRIDLRAQDILTFGNDLTAFRNVSDTFRANGNSVAAAVRYLHSPFGVPGYQLSLTGGYRSYARVHDAGSYGVALTGVKRLGQGFDAVAQYLYERRNSALSAAYGGAPTEQSIQLGFIFNFDATFNQHIGPRRSLLNLQHQYIPE